MTRRPTLLRHLLTTALPASIVLCAGSGLAVAEPMIGRSFNNYGLPGAVDTPSAEMLPDAELTATAAKSELTERVGLVFQLAPRVTTALRYGKFDSTEERRGYVRDRSFDLRFQILDEAAGTWRPAVAVGIQDAIGTGFYSAEYIVATKTITPTLRASAGLGWGRLAQGGGIGSPFGDRPGPDTGTGGELNADTWFKGEVAPFASVAWAAGDKLTLVAEYSGDEYACETGDADTCARSVWLSDSDPLKNRINFGATYQLGQNYQVGAYVLGAKHVGVQFTLLTSPRRAAYPSGLEPAPAPVRPRPDRASDPDGWSGVWASDPTAQPAIQKALGDALADEGQRLESMVLTADRAEIRIRNERYIQQAEAVGRAARLMTRALPPSVETLVITSSEAGMPTSSVTLRRSDVERLENTEAGQIANAAALTDAVPRPAGLVPTPGEFPDLDWAIKPYLSTGLFDPDEPFRYEVGGEVTARYEIVPGLVLQGSLRQRAFGNAEQEAPGSYAVDEYLALSDDEITGQNNGVYRVRSDSRMYTGNDKLQVPRLTLNWYGRPTQTVYSRVTVGLLERMYGGASAELLWKPVNSQLALGAEINRVRKRDYRDAFELLDYEATTGLVTAYYEFGNGFRGSIGAGQYLAGDVGATVEVSREFANGWEVGAFVTKTDLSADEFGEGSFDKGVTISVPLSWGTGLPSLRTVGGTLSSLNRDGGQQVNVRGRLYETIRDSHSVRMYDGWGKFWR